jgi:hypothetical protein
MDTQRCVNVLKNPRRHNSNARREAPDVQCPNLFGLCFRVDGQVAFSGWQKDLKGQYPSDSAGDWYDRNHPAPQLRGSFGRPIVAYHDCRADVVGL